MADRVARYKRRKEILTSVRANRAGRDDRDEASQVVVYTSSNSSLEVFEAFERSQREDELLIASPVQVTSEEVDGLLCQVRDAWDKAKFEELLAGCRRQIIMSVAGPFGLGEIVATYDKVGGNVDTIHNVRQEIYVTKAEEQRYEMHDQYDSHDYHANRDYIAKNREFSAQKDEGRLKDAYTGKTIGRNKPSDLDHCIPASEVHNDRGRILAEVYGPDLANAEINLNPTDRSINRSKKHNTTDHYLEWLDSNHEERQRRIAELSGKDSLNDQERKVLDKLRALEDVDPAAMREKDRQARQEYERTLAKTYYTSSKFAKNLLSTSCVEASKMGMQQAFGLLLMDLCESLYLEVRDSVRKGIRTETGMEGYLDALAFRARRVGEAVISDWKNILAALRDGAISGLISNILTTFINAFCTTAKRIVRMIREGVMSLLRAMKLLLLRPEGMTKEQAADAALKLIATGVLTGVGIIAEEYIEKALMPVLAGIPVVGSFASAIIAALTGSLVGLASSLVVYTLDQIDLFGIHAGERNRAVYAELERRLLIVEKDIDATFQTAMNPFVLPVA